MHSIQSNNKKILGALSFNIMIFTQIMENFVELRRHYHLNPKCNGTDNIDCQLPVAGIGKKFSRRVNIRRLSLDSTWNFRCENTAADIVRAKSVNSIDSPMPTDSVHHR
ncbi:uncharacterized protein LOC135163450 [Diachasmimorpha longicaudata]|uniref:uncharacterized protein LOC135163450 n=1 Tax=Diachasmimorpha longicaudata TaxID=58733 RepID=UPI0030B9137C